MDQEQQDQGMDAYARIDRPPWPDEQERRMGRLPRSLEIASHPGADCLATRWVVRAMLSTMQQRDGPMNQYSVEHLEEALDYRVWNLPSGIGLEPALREEITAIKGETGVLQDEIDARVCLQGAFDNVLKVGPNLGDYGDLLIKYWKITPNAGDFWVLGNLSVTPEGIEEVEDEVLGSWRTIETEKENIKTGEWEPRVEKKREARREIVGYKGKVKEGEPTLGSKVDLALRRFVDLSIVKAPVWVLKKKIWKSLSEKEIKARQQQIQQRLGVTEEELGTLSSLGADKPFQEKTDATREFVRELVGDKDAERIAYQLYYVMELATKFGLSGTEEKPEITGFPACTDLFNMFHFEERRKTEHDEGRPAGPPSTLGCYTDLAVSLMDFIKVDDLEDHRPEEVKRQISFWTLWYEKGTAFGKLPWGKVRRNIFDFHLVQRWKAHDVHTAASKVTDWDLEREVLNTEHWRKLNKSIQLAMVMLGLGSEAGKEQGKEFTDNVIKGIKLNILGGAIICNMPTSFLKAVEANPPEVASSAQWDKRLNMGSKVVMAILKGVITRSGFLDEDGWKDCIKNVVEPRQGIKIEV